mmetsp:Transcript_25607/g.48478  ORF Transcript_25607/g.48478 Transcript_25607/m.48478 type:complete len:309 (+) Transcript_25607:593-1519(+)
MLLIPGIGEELLAPAPPVERTTRCFRRFALSCRTTASHVLTGITHDTFAIAYSTIRLKASLLLWIHAHTLVIRNSVPRGTSTLTWTIEKLIGTTTAIATESHRVPFCVHLKLNKGVRMVGMWVREWNLATTLAVLPLCCNSVTVLENIVVRVVAAVATLVRHATVINGAQKGHFLKFDADRRQRPRGIAKVIENNHVREESSECLHNAYLKVGKRNQTRVHQTIGCRVTGSTIHNVRFLLLIRERDCRDHVCAEVNAQDQHCRQGQWNTECNEHQERADFRNVGSKRVADGLLQVVEDQASLLNSIHN